MKITWSAVSLSDRDAIFTRIEADNPRAAISTDERIVAATRRLLQFPMRGRAGRVADTRELVVGRTPFIIVYRVTDDAVRIVSMLHGAQLWPSAFPIR